MVLMLCDSVGFDSSNAMKASNKSPLPTRDRLPITPLPSSTHTPLELRCKHDDDEAPNMNAFSNHSRPDDFLFSSSDGPPSTPPPSSPPISSFRPSPVSAATDDYDEEEDEELNPVQQYSLTSMQGQVDLSVRLLLSACASLRHQHNSVDARLEERYKKADGPRYRRCAPHNHAGRANSSLVMHTDPAESEIIARVHSLFDMTKSTEREKLKYARQNGIDVDRSAGNWEARMNEVLVEVAGGVHWWCREAH